MGWWAGRQGLVAEIITIQAIGWQASTVNSGCDFAMDLEAPGCGDITSVGLWIVPLSNDLACNFDMVPEAQAEQGL